MSDTSAYSMKVCTTCLILLPLSMFHRSQKRKDGHSCTCKICYKDYRRQYYLKNRDTILSKNRSRLSVYLSERGDVWAKRSQARKLHERKERSELRDVYIKTQLVQGTSLMHRDIPKELIYTKRAQLMLLRAAKETK